MFSPPLISSRTDHSSHLGFNPSPSELGGKRFLPAPASFGQFDPLLAVVLGVVAEDGPRVFEVEPPASVVADTVENVELDGVVAQAAVDLMCAIPADCRTPFMRFIFRSRTVSSSSSVEASTEKSLWMSP